MFQDPFFGRVVSGVVRALRPKGMHPLLMFADNAEDRAEVVAHLTQGSADGALLVTTRPRDPLPGVLAAARLAGGAVRETMRPGFCSTTWMCGTAKAGHWRRGTCRL